MHPQVVLLSIPGLRERGMSSMPNLSRLALGGGYASLIPSFPAVTCPVQANMMTGKLPREHGVVANGFYWRDQRRVEMWTSWNDCIQRPQIWDILHERDRSITSAVWFALHSRGCGADYLCTPAPVHNPDGSESLWCETRPEMIYSELEPKLGHFPLQHFWGPLAGIQSTAWIVASAVHTAEKYRPNFFYIYLPHLDYAAQKTGPDSTAAKKALVELDAEIGKLVDGFENAYRESPLWLVASEYAIVPVEDVTYPNRVLREAKLLKVIDNGEGETIDFAESLRVCAGRPSALSRVRERRRSQDDQARRGPVQKAVRYCGNAYWRGVGQVRPRSLSQRRGRARLRAKQLAGVLLVGRRRPGPQIRADRRHPPQTGLRSRRAVCGQKDEKHPARRDAREGLARRPAATPSQRGVLLSSEAGIFQGPTVKDVDIANIVLRQFELG